MKRCVLIYDDDPEILFLCKEILARDNFRVETLSRCEDVISDIALFKPGIVLMDLWIPKMGGEKAILIIKENPDTKHIPVLIFSANTDVKEIAKKINADGYIEKPFDIVDFKKIIEKNIL